MRLAAQIPVLHLQGFRPLRGFRLQRCELVIGVFQFHIGRRALFQFRIALLQGGEFGFRLVQPFEQGCVLPGRGGAFFGHFGHPCAQFLVLLGETLHLEGGRRRLGQVARQHPSFDAFGLDEGPVLFGLEHFHGRAGRQHLQDLVAVGRAGAQRNLKRIGYIGRLRKGCASRDQHRHHGRYQISCHELPFDLAARQGRVKRQCTAQRGDIQPGRVGPSKAIHWSPNTRREVKRKNVFGLHSRSADRAACARYPSRSRIRG